jgi:hypothetical protein
MIDATTVTNELQQARMARIAAEAACCDIEEMLWDMQRSRRLWHRLPQTDAAVEAGAALPLAA